MWRIFSNFLLITNTRNVSKHFLFLFIQEELQVKDRACCGGLKLKKSYLLERSVDTVPIIQKTLLGFVLYYIFRILRLSDLKPDPEKLKDAK